MHNVKLIMFGSNELNFFVFVQSRVNLWFKYSEKKLIFFEL